MNPMKNLLVYIEVNGERRLAGRIAGTNTEDAVFTYDPSYLQTGSAISVHLPLQEQAFDVSATKCFFEGLLPEGFSRKSVAAWIHVDENDYLSILRTLGKECIGAIQIVEEGDPESDSKAYRRLSLSEVKELAAEGAVESTKLLVQSHLSLAGASGKVGLYLRNSPHDSSADSYDSGYHAEWYQPIGLAPSTHIVKQSHVRLQNLVENEQLALKTASLLGIPTVESFIVYAGNDGTAASVPEDKDILLATKRYDRDLNHATRQIDGLSCPLRLHQEDFAQAMGIQSKDKYEPEGKHYLQQIFTLLRNTVSNPLQDERTLLDLLIFDTLIGNTDNHIKNLSLLYRPDLCDIGLAPAYDLVSTIVYRESTSEMSISIGGEKQWNRIGKKTFQAAAGEMGISAKLTGREYDRLSAAFPNALHQAAENLVAQGFPNISRMEQKIMRKVMEKNEMLSGK